MQFYEISLTCLPEAKKVNSSAYLAPFEEVIERNNFFQRFTSSTDQSEATTDGSYGAVYKYNKTAEIDRKPETRWETTLWTFSKYILP